VLGSRLPKPLFIVINFDDQPLPLALRLFICVLPRQLVSHSSGP
jgi:hypothetical protein